LYGWDQICNNSLSIDLEDKHKQNFNDKVGLQEEPSSFIFPLDIIPIILLFKFKLTTCIYIVEDKVNRSK